LPVPSHVLFSYPDFHEWLSEAKRNQRTIRYEDVAGAFMVVLREVCNREWKHARRQAMAVFMPLLLCLVKARLRIRSHRAKAWLVPPIMSFSKRLYACLETFRSHVGIMEPGDTYDSWQERLANNNGVYEIV
jgi:hypothetical protein